MSVAKRVGTSVVVLGMALVALSACLAVGPPTTLLTDARANDVNADGLVVGDRRVGSGPEFEAFVHDPATGVTTMLGTLGGSYSSATAVNDDGTVVGWSSTEETGHRAFVWDPIGGMRSIGTLPGFDCEDEPCEGWSEAEDINEDGVIVGTSTYFESGMPIGAPFVYDAVGGIRMLPIDSGRDGAATAINDAGTIVGWRNTYGPTGWRVRAFSLDLHTAAVADLGTLGGEQAIASDINEDGLIVGTSQLAGAPTCSAFSDSCPDTHAFVHDPTTGAMTDLGTLLGATRSGAFGISDAGVVVGRSTASPAPSCGGCHDRTRATVWEVGTTGRYEVVGSDEDHDTTVAAVNAGGLVVGSTWDPIEQRPTAFTALVQVVPDP